MPEDWKARAQRAEFLLALALAARMDPPAEFAEWAAERSRAYETARAGINPRAHRYSQ